MPLTNWSFMMTPVVVNDPVLGLTGGLAGSLLNALNMASAKNSVHDLPELLAMCS